MPSTATRLRSLCAAAFAACASVHAADAPYADMAPASRQVCTAAPDYPARDQPPPSQPACDASAAYYGIGEPVNPAKARACAYVGKDYDILAMLYANGEGVPRDYGVARKATCDADGAPAEISGRLAHLSRMETQGPAKAGHFDFCDDITSGLMMGYCENIAARRADQVRDARLTAITVDWSPASKGAFGALLQARDAFITAHDAEVDLGGTDRAAALIAQEQAQRKAFLALLEQAESGRLADASPARAQALDARLNATWRRLKATPDPREASGVQLAGIQRAQRAWLRYRDAWVALGKVRYPDVPASAWLAVLTEQRDQQLAGLLEDRR